MEVWEEGGVERTAEQVGVLAGAHTPARIAGSSLLQQKKARVGGTGSGSERCHLCMGMKHFV